MLGLKPSLARAGREDFSSMADAVSRCLTERATCPVSSRMNAACGSVPAASGIRVSFAA